jgi:uncharacterized membrane protein YfcA
MLSGLALLVLLGMVTGFFAGLFGIGGGALLVPSLSAYFLWHQVDPAVAAHMALATSMSCIIVNAILSIRTHQQHRAILWPLVSLLTPFVILGSLLASFGVLQIAANQVALIFLVLMLLVATHMLLGVHPESPHEASPISLFNGALSGFLIGGISAMIAIGGGSLSVPYMTWHGIRIQQAIGTAAALGLPIALAATVIFSWQANATLNTPELTLGLVYWPATLALSCGSVLTTAAGARLTHRLPVGLLKKAFAVLIMILAGHMFLTFH